MKKIYLSLLLFFFLVPDEALSQCVTTISLDTRVAGTWVATCPSQNSNGRYAKYYTFTLSSTQQVTIDLESSTDPVLFLLDGAGQTGTVIATNDDRTNNNRDSRIIQTLAAGAYTVEATTWAAGATGSFFVTVSTSSAPTDECINSIGFNTEVSGAWQSKCTSTHREGHYAKYFTFSLSSAREVTIDLESAADPYLFLLSGSGQTGSVLEINDDISNRDKNSRIVRVLSAGSYTIEATTYEPATTGDFVVSVTVASPPPGSLPFIINAGLNDAWYNLATNGQGLLITVYPVREQMFVTWFTFDKERPADDADAIIGEPGHRWFTAQGPYEGDTAELIIYLTKGGVFDAAEPRAETGQDGIGTMTIEFADCNNALVTYQITTPDISGEVPIQRIVTENVPACELLVEQLQ